MTAFYKIMTDKAWRDFQLLNIYGGSDVDKADGYIHFSTSDQLLETLEKHYAGQNGLVVLEIDGQALDAAHLKWEPARGGALFPHLYADLPLAAVRQAVTVALLDDGRFAVPDDFLTHA